MAKVLYSATMSLDGFIAGPGGDMSWMKPFFEPDEETDELAADIGALLVGNRTHRGDDPNRGTENEGAFGGTWDGPYFLLTHHPSITPEPGVTVVHDLESGLAAAKRGRRQVRRHPRRRRRTPMSRDRRTRRGDGEHRADLPRRRHTPVLLSRRQAGAARANDGVAHSDLDEYLGEGRPLALFVEPAHRSRQTKQEPRRASGQPPALRGLHLPCLHPER